jgi:hypothetical protein
MPTVKTQGGKVITKGGKVSCECCGIGCPLSNCVVSSGDGNNPAVCAISKTTAQLYKAGGTFTLNVQAAIDASFDLTDVDQRYKTITSIFETRSITQTNSCGYTFPTFSATAPDFGGLFTLSTDQLITAAAAATLEFSASISLRETTAGASFCVSINMVPRSFVGQYHSINSSITGFDSDPTSLAFGGCVLSFPTILTPRAPWRFASSPLFLQTGSNPQGSGSLTASIDFVPSAP